MSSTIWELWEIVKAVLHEKPFLTMFLDSTLSSTPLLVVRPRFAQRCVYPVAAAVFTWRRRSVVTDE